jgi:hypothetical protein
MKKRKENKEKSKCVLRVVPQSEKCESLEVDTKCIKTRGSPA